MNYKLILSLFLVLGMTQMGLAQKYFSKTGAISFSSTTPMEDIEATSNSASTVFVKESGKIQWAVLIKSFEFEKALMQEHFNENYMESSTYPKAKFTGMIENPETLDFSKDGTITVPVAGKLSIHGKTQEVEADATFIIKGNKVSGSSELKIAVADYGIEIPAVVRENIAKEITITIQAQYEVLN